VALTSRGVDRWKAGYPWIYQSDVVAGPSLQGGEAVRVLDARGWLLGQAFYSRRSKIALRWMAADDTPIDAELFRARIAAADGLRTTAFPGETTYRAVHGESDLMPGVVVDRYGDYLSIQFLIAATDQRREQLTDLLVAHFKAKGAVERSDVGARLLEGLELRKGPLRGQVPERIPFREGQVTLLADLLGGQKTGTFLDQRENHIRAGEYARGQALDCFSYTGAFALQMAQRADHVTAVEISDAAAAQIRAHAEANGAKNLEVVVANAFDFLRDAVDDGRKFDTVVLDPPSFAKNKAAIPGALRGYKEINLRALQLLRPGGHLITASCTYHVDEAAFEELLRSAAADARRQVQVVERRGASRDHPVLLSLRETRYLKCFVLRAL
jgi:23S rRNA (cytosine1962-C5)-methyltransferase